MTATDAEAWAKANPQEALVLALNVIGEQSSVIAPWVIHLSGDAGEPPMRVEVFKGHHAAARRAEVEAEVRLHAAHREAAEA